MCCHSCCCRHGRRPARLVDTFDVAPAEPYDGPLITPTGARPQPRLAADGDGPRIAPRLPDPFREPRSGILRRLVTVLRSTRR